MEMTIKQLADEFGVSKDKVKYQVRKLPSNYLGKKGNVTYVKEQGIIRLREIFEKNYLGNSLGKNGENYPDFTHYEKLIDMLEKELETLRGQLEEKDEQIKKAHTLLDQEQQLRLAEMTKQALLEEKPKGFWSRLLGK